MSETGHHDRRDELAAYLLGAMEPGEAAELERHLAGCDRCGEELGWLRPAIQVLPESVERVEPSPALRARIMEQARAEAGPSTAPSAQQVSPMRGLRKRFVGGIGSLGLRPAASLAAVALVLAAVVAGYAIRDSGSGGGATTVVADQASGIEVEMVREGDSGTLKLANMSQAPPDKVMQAWVLRGTRVAPAGVFRPEPDGTATVRITDMRGVDEVMVTAEPRGGSPSPTSPPIVAVAVPQ